MTRGGLLVVVGTQVYFYDEFYKRLFDRSEAFNSFFSGDMKKKGMVRLDSMGRRNAAKRTKPVDG